MTQATLLQTADAKPKQSNSAEFSLQRKWACGNTATGIAGESNERQRERPFGLQPKLQARGTRDPLGPEADRPADQERRGPLALASLPSGLGYEFGNVRIHYAVAESLQGKLTVNESGDKYEQEADRVADEIMRMPEPPTPAGRRHELPQVAQQSVSLAHVHDSEVCSAQGLPRISAFQSHHGPSFAQRQEERSPTGAADQSEVEEDDERLPDEPLLLQRETGSVRNAPAFLGCGLRQSRGNPLPASTRAYMEPRFGLDFSHVRIHTGPVAHRMSTAIGAAAFTYRNNVFFKNGRFSPETSAGRRLLAHELTHIVQQTGNSTTRARGFEDGSIAIQRAAEVHVNLQGNDRVKVYRDSGGDLGGADGFLASSGRPRDKTTEGDLSITGKRTDPTAKVGIWGLRYFATFSRGQGFHSHITWPTRRTMCREFRRFCTPASELNSRVEHLLTVNGNELSHGCVRLREANAQAVFEAVSVGTPVKIYREKAFRPSPFASRGGGSGSSSRRTHTVVRGDTLSEIAQQYGVSVDALRRANDIPADSSHIEVGQTLVIPSG